MGIDKSKLMNMFQKEPDKYWKVNLFNKDYERRKCTSCDKYFWNNSGTTICGDPPCGEYTFIGKPPIKKWTT